MLTTSGFFPRGEDGIEDTLDEANVVRVWELRSGAILYEFRDHGRRVLDGTFLADGKSVVAIDSLGAVYVYPCEMCVPLQELLEFAELHNVRPLTPDERVRYLQESRGD